MLNTTTITLNGEQRDIAFGTYGIRMAESVMGRSIASMNNAIGITEMVALLYGGLKQLDRSVTVEKVEDAIDEHLSSGESIEAIASGVSEALQASGWFSGHPTRGGK